MHLHGNYWFFIRLPSIQQWHHATQFNNLVHASTHFVNDVVTPALSCSLLLHVEQFADHFPSTVL